MCVVLFTSEMKDNVWNAKATKTCKDNIGVRHVILWSHQIWCIFEFSQESLSETFAVQQLCNFNKWFK